MTRSCRKGKQSRRHTIIGMFGRGIILAAGLLTISADYNSAKAEGTGQANDPSTSLNRILEDFNPLDIRRAIREHFYTMPYGWWISDPARYLNGFEVTLNIPDWWSGNPTSAAGNLCPDRRSRIWEETVSVTIKPFYNKRPWPMVECRQ